MTDPTGPSLRDSDGGAAAADPSGGLPEWARDLLGVDVLGSPPDFRSGRWAVHVWLPQDLSELEGVIDPLLLLMNGGHIHAQVEQRLRALVHMARGQGRSWAEIGRALGVSKQTAWERYASAPTAGPAE